MAPLSDSALTLTQLPPEIILVIFRILAEGPQISGRLYRTSTAWLALSSACRNLRDLACQTPTLWAKADIHDDIRWLELSLDRSADVPVDLVLYKPWTIPPAVQLLLLHNSRIRQLVIIQASADTLTALKPLLSVPLPQLEVLHIHANATRIEDYSPFDDDEVDLLPALVPRLHSLHLGRVPFSWRSAVLPQLRRLALQYSRPNTWIPQTEFMHVLGACASSLEYLKISFCLPYDIDALAADPSIVVSLPNLATLDLRCTSPREVHSLLSHLALSEHVELIVYSDVMTDDIDDMSSTLLDALPARPDRIPILATATSASLRGWLMFECSHADTHPNPNGSSPPGRVQVFLDPDLHELWDYTPRQSLEDFRTLLSGAPLTRLMLSPDSLSMQDSASYIALFQAFPALAQLEFTVLSYTSGFILYGALSAADADGTGCVLPRLQTLKLVTDHEHYDAEHLGGVRPVLAARERLGAPRLCKLSILVTGGSLPEHTAWHAECLRVFEAGLGHLRDVAGEVVYESTQ